MSGRAKKRKTLSFMSDPVTAEEKTDSGNMKSKANEFTETKPIVFDNSAFSKQRSRQNINVTSGSSSNQRKQKTGLRENTAGVSKKETPACPTIDDKIKDAPAQMKHKDKAPTEKPKKQQEKPRVLISCFTSVINGLTPETLQASVRQLKQLNFESEENAKSVISIVYERALLRPSSSGLYATICQSLLKIQVPRNADPTTSVSFRKLFVRHCKNQFQVYHTKDYGLEQRRRRPETVKDEEELQLNNIRFLCELYKARILSVAVIHLCITTLLDNRDDESMECACELLKTIETDLKLRAAKHMQDSDVKGTKRSRKQKKRASRPRPLLRNTARLTETNWLSDTGVIADKPKKYRRNKQNDSLTKRTQAMYNMKMTSKEIIYRSMETGNLRKAVQHVRQLNPSLMHMFVRSAADLSLASSSEIRLFVGLLLWRIHNLGLLSTEQFIEGLEEVLEMAENISFSSPGVWLSLAELIQPILLPGGVSVAHFHEQILAYVSLKHVTELLRHIVPWLCNRDQFCATATFDHPVPLFP